MSYQTIMPLTTVTATGNSDAMHARPRGQNWAYLLRTTATATDGTDFVAIIIEGQLEVGGAWIDLARFNIVAGDTATRTSALYVVSNSYEGEVFVSTGIGAGGTVRPLIPVMIRTSYTVTEGNAASFTFTTGIVSG